MTENMTKTELLNCSQNIRYLFNCVHPAFTQSDYIPNQTIPGLKISLSTLKNILSGKRISDRTLQMIAGSFSMTLSEQSESIITADDLLQSPDIFKLRFPENQFSKTIENGPVFKSELFTNKLFRGYYMINDSSSCACMAYLKIFETRGKFQAFLVYGIPDFHLVQDVRNNFDLPEKLIMCSRDKNSSFYNNKRTEGMSLLMAEGEHIQMTTDCIKIDFHHLDSDIIQCSLFWYVHQIFQSPEKIYIGGTGILVDTNNGPIKQDIWVHKIGFEAIEKNGGAYPEDIEPFDSQSELLVRELMPEIKNGMIILDNRDDNCWYHFLLNHTYRNRESAAMHNTEVGQLLNDLHAMKRDYERELTRLREFLDEQEKK